MSLAAGTRLGPYEIESLLGEGGMGEVYKARDTQLKREVALKILPSDVALDPERLGRFDREAQTLAALNHPRIAQVYGFVREANTRAIVMELVEGLTLAGRIARGPIPLDDALRLAIQLAEALEYAHEHGIVHRDLKPANIKLTPDGDVKVLDFGLAKILTEEVSSTPDNSPTITTCPAISRAGVILGTAAYMAPEQARGAPVDRRADIWAFGAVLFEVLTGKRCFSGETWTDVLAAVINREPDWSVLSAAIPSRLHELVQRCLAKDRKQRLHDIGDARLELQGIAAAARSPREAAAPAATARRRRATMVALVALTAIAAAVAGVAGGRLLSRPVTQVWIGELLGGPELALSPRISPTGDVLAFQQMVDGTSQVAVMKPETGVSQVLTHASNTGWVNQISWEPDGNRIYFDRVGTVPLGVYSTTPVPGDERLEVADAFAPEVLPDGSLLAVKLNENRRFQIYHVADGKRHPLPVYLARSSKLIDVIDSTRYRTSRDGKQAFAVGYLAADPAERPGLYAVRLETNEARRIPTGLASDDVIKALAPGPGPDTILVAAQVGDLMQVLALPTNGRGERHALFTASDPIWFLDTGPDGTVYADTVAISRTFVRFDAEGGHAEKVGFLQTQPGAFMDVTLLLDGRAVYLGLRGDRTRLMIAAPRSDPFPLLKPGEHVIPGPITAVGRDEVAFLQEAESGPISVASTANGQLRRRVPLSKGPIDTLAASPDGRTLFAVAGGAVWSIPMEGAPTRICDGDHVAIEPSGRNLIVKRIDAGGARLLRVPLDGGTPAEIPLSGSLRLAYMPLRSEGIAPDGRMVAPLLPPNSWYQVPGLVDLATGRTTRIPVDLSGDYLFMAWTRDRQVLAAVAEYRFSLWRFRPGPR